MATDDEIKLLRFLLIVDDLDDLGESDVYWSIRYLKHRFQDQFFSSWPDSSWPDSKRMRSAIEAISSLGHDGLVEFSESGTFTLKNRDGDRDSRREEFRLWIETHRLPMSVVDARLERLTPIWWTPEWSRHPAENLDWGTTPAGEALFEQWFHDPPPEAGPWRASFGPPWFVVRHARDQVWYEGYDRAEADRVREARPGSYLIIHGGGRPIGPSRPLATDPPADHDS